jgi:uncharacterized membrane protein YtjA (UPF0391 family)
LQTAGRDWFLRLFSGLLAPARHLRYALATANGAHFIGPPSDAAAANRPDHSLENAMLRWALIFLIVALVAGALSLGAVAGTAAWIAKILFVVFIVLFLVSLVAGRRPPVV